MIKKKKTVKIKPMIPNSILVQASKMVFEWLALRKVDGRRLPDVEQPWSVLINKAEIGEESIEQYSGKHNRSFRMKKYLVGVNRKTKGLIDCYFTIELFSIARKPTMEEIIKPGRDRC